MNVSEEIVEFVDSNIYDNDDLIADPNSPTRPKWEANTIHAAGERLEILMILGELDLILRVLCA